MQFLKLREQELRKVNNQIDGKRIILAGQVLKIKENEDRLKKLEEKDIPLRDIDIVKGRWFRDRKQFLAKVKDKYFTHKVVVINMELLNGFHKSFVVMESDGGFKFGKGKYLLDNESKYYNTSIKMWCYDFHQAFALPIKRSIPVTDIKKAVDFSGLTEVESATNPRTLENFVKSKIAEGLFKGGKLDEWVRQIKLMSLIILIGVIVHLLLFMQKTGMLQQLTEKLPF